MVRDSVAPGSQTKVAIVVTGPSAIKGTQSDNVLLVARLKLLVNIRGIWSKPRINTCV